MQSLHLNEREENVMLTAILAARIVRVSRWSARNWKDASHDIGNHR